MRMSFYRVQTFNVFFSNKEAFAADKKKVQWAKNQ